MAWSKWFETDNDCCQHMRNDDLRYEMIQAVWLDTTKEDRANGLREYVVVKGGVDLADEDDDNIIGAISVYGYTIPQLIQTYGETANKIIAECILEDESMCDGCTLGNFDSFEDAKAFILDYIRQ